MDPADIAIRSLSGEEAIRRVRELSGVLIDCVNGGASVSFMAPLNPRKADDFWLDVARGVQGGDRVLLVAEESASNAIVGTVLLVLGQPENQPHRADIAKMLVHTRARRRGAGAALMSAAEQEARRLRRTLLVLDTASEDAERLYERAGWIRVGVVPGYALWPQGGLCDTTFFYKKLD